MKKKWFWSIKFIFNEEKRQKCIQQIAFENILVDNQYLILERNRVALVNIDTKKRLEVTYIILLWQKIKINNSKIILNKIQGNKIRLKKKAFKNLF